MKLKYSSVFMACSVVAAGVPALAVDIPRLTVDADAVQDRAADSILQADDAVDPGDNSSAMKLTLYWENDGGWAKPITDTDKHYTAGVGAAVSFQSPWINSILSQVPSFGNEFDRENSRYAMGVVGGLDIFTPEDYRVSTPIHNDRPYAGWTYGGLFLQRANRAARVPVFESLEFDVGILGPSSLAENAQFMIHHVFHYVIPQGWNNQINDEAEFDIKYNRRWRLSVWSQENHLPGFEILPEAGLTVGSLLDEAHVGGVFRLGWNMPNDFGPGHLSNPADFTWRAPTSSGNWLENFFSKQSFYVFARPYGEVVARNVLLQGDTWSDRDPVTVNPTPGFFGVEYGLSHRFADHFEFTYAWTTESKQFDRQHNWDTWASVQLSFFIAW